MQPNRDSKQYRSPLEKRLRKSYAEMTIKEIAIIKIIGTLVAGFLMVAGLLLIHIFNKKMLPLGVYCFIFLFIVIISYLVMTIIFWFEIRKRKNTENGTGNKTHV